MFVLAHMGIGSKMVSFWDRTLPMRWLLLGSLLPDIIDKPLYYGLSLLTGKKGIYLGLLGGTRTLGHTFLFLLFFLLISLVTRKKLFIAISSGIASHLILDGIADIFLTPFGKEKSAWTALIFPLGGARFAPMPFEEGIKEHAGAHFNYFTLTCELIGLWLLSSDFLKRKNRTLLFRIPNRFRKKPQGPYEQVQ